MLDGRLDSCGTYETVPSERSRIIPATDYQRSERHLLVTDGTRILEDGRGALSRTAEIECCVIERGARKAVQPTPIIPEPVRRGATNKGRRRCLVSLSSREKG